MTKNHNTVCRRQFRIAQLWYLNTPTCSYRQAQSQTRTFVSQLQLVNVINSYMPYIYFKISYLAKNKKYYCLFHILFKRIESYTNYDNGIKRKVSAVTEQQDQLKCSRSEFRLALRLRISAHACKTP